MVPYQVSRASTVHMLVIVNFFIGSSAAALKENKDGYGGSFYEIGGAVWNT